ncbi:hypothetical protein [Pseudoprimorskyibacter insulae]|uniref:Excalibur calcium-binding domain-containing protein n=1 Tax=Pseudoprimorskyibacter insulae TaxID=1695997 RepID=A0A2R8AQI0_9RHOB|nr:hypothetical protein [Pseudoprimorskyibacter insulae]SPF78358.1 hypothetical protein PRI8871_00955 [Pseudoprimorskyibacter insulae]
MKRAILGTVAILMVAACDPQIPDSAAGVGFDNYDSYRERQRQREEALSGRVSVPAPARVTETTLDDAANSQARDANSGVEPVNASPSNPAPQVVTNSSGISNENDFSAVSDVRSIQSDADRIAQNRAQYQQVQPTALPSRSGSDGPNIVEYALNSTNPMGNSIYRRVGINLASKNLRNCASYPSPDRAQEEFLAKGGPQKDRLALDIDGDGYACDWNPRPFQLARQAARQGQN